MRPLKDVAKSHVLRLFRGYAEGVSPGRRSFQFARKFAGMSDDMAAKPRHL